MMLIAEASSSAMPMSFAGGDLIATLKEYGEAPVRTVSCVGAQGSGKSTLMRSIFGAEAEAGVTGQGLALLEASSNCAYLPDSNEFAVGAGQAMVSLAVSDVMIYNVLVHDLTRPDGLSDLQVSAAISALCSVPQIMLATMFVCNQRCRADVDIMSTATASLYSDHL